MNLRTVKAVVLLFVIPYYTSAIKVQGYLYIGVTLSVHLSARRCLCKHNSSLTYRLILMTLYIVAVYKLRICMKEANPCPNYFKGDN